MHIPQAKISSEHIVERDALDEFVALATSRRSIRRYRSDPVPGDILEDLLRAAIKAPNAHNRQPWRFVVMTDKTAQRHLADKMALPFRQDLLRDGHMPEEADGIVRRSKERIGEAPALILANLSMADMDTYPDDERQRCERLMAAQGVALACQNLLLAAHAAGLGACWMCAPIFCPDTVRGALALPVDWEPQGLLTLGWPANEGRVRERKPLDEVVRWMT